MTAIDPYNPQLKIHTNSELYYETGKGLPVDFICNITPEAHGWRRSIRGMGGYWEGSFWIEGDIKDLSNVFQHWLGYNLREISAGQKTWEGQIVEMDLVYKGVARRRSIDLLRNYIIVEYLDHEGERQQTAAGENVDSTGRYGRYEWIITADGMDSTAAVALRDTQLKRWSWPTTQVVGAASGSEFGKTAVIEFTLAGYIHSANRRFQSTGDGTAANVSTWIYNLLDTDCEFLHPGAINTNALQVYQTTSQPRRVWDLMKDLTMLGDSDNHQWRLYCFNDGQVNYEEVSTTKQYYIQDGNLCAWGSNKQANPWAVRPAVVRDMNLWPTLSMSGGWLTDGRDFYASEIDVGVDTGLQIKSEYFDEGEFTIARLNWLMENEKAADGDLDLEGSIGLS